MCVVQGRGCRSRARGRGRARACQGGFDLTTATERTKATSRARGEGEKGLPEGGGSPRGCRRRGSARDDDGDVQAEMDDGDRGVLPRR